MSQSTSILVATGNQGKLREIQAIMSRLPVTVLGQTDFVQGEAEETGQSFVENALIKARFAARQVDMPVIADDSGIEVAALSGEPGVRSARYAGEQASDEDNLQLLLERTQHLNNDERAARFYCAMVYMDGRDDATPIIAEAGWDGQLLKSPTGANGFGYDPVFYVPTHDCSSAELSPELKNSLSHRAQALQILLQRLRPIDKV